MNTVTKINTPAPDTLNNDVEHPIGTTVGAAGGAVAGASIGAAGGPITMVAGAAIGAVIGAVTGEAVTESLDFTSNEDAYWRDMHTTRPYVKPTDSYESYRPAYRYGTEAYGKNAGKGYEEVRGQLQSDWEATPTHTSFAWDQAEPAVRDAYSRSAEYSVNKTKKAS